MNPKSSEARSRDDKPFEGMCITEDNVLAELTNRSPCPVCFKSRMYYCYTCYVPVAYLRDKIPTCKLPVKVDIIKHRREIDGKSTSAHAAILAPEDVAVYTYPDMPDYSLDGQTVLLFPGTNSKTVSELFTGTNGSISYSEYLLSQLPSGYNVGTLRTKLLTTEDELSVIHHSIKLPIDKVVLIDSTWNQSRGIYADERLQNLPTIVLQKRISQFWRHQKGSPRWYLSTIEAIHQLMVELHICAWGCSAGYRTALSSDYPIHDPVFSHQQCQPYSGQYDNLLYFFKYMYEKLHNLYKHEDMLAYKRPML